MNMYKKVTITLKSNLTFDEINHLLEDIFYDGSHFDDLEDVDWEIKE